MKLIQIKAVFFSFKKMVNKVKAATDELWQLYNKAITEQDMEITRKDDQYLKVLQESDAKMCKRMEVSGSSRVQEGLLFDHEILAMRQANH